MTGALYADANCYIFLASALFTLRLTRYSMPTSLRTQPVALHMQLFGIDLLANALAILTRSILAHQFHQNMVVQEPWLDTQPGQQRSRCPLQVFVYSFGPLDVVCFGKQCALSSCTSTGTTYTVAHLQAQPQPQVHSMAGRTTDTTRPTVDMTENHEKHSQPGSPPSLTSEGPMPPPGLTNSPPRGPPPARPMPSEADVSLRISGAVANVLQSCGHSQLRRIATDLPEGWQLMPGMILIARRLTAFESTHPRLLEIGDMPPEAGIPAPTNTDTGAVRVSEDELANVMLELFEEGSLTELLEDDSALQAAVHRSTMRSGGPETSETSEAPTRAKAKAKSEATSASSAKRKPETHLLQCPIQCSQSVPLQASACIRAHVCDPDRVSSGDFWSPPHTESPFASTNRSLGHQSQSPLQTAELDSAQGCPSASRVQAMHAHLSSATNGRALIRQTGLMKMIACILVTATSLYSASSMSRMARYNRSTVFRTRLGSCLFRGLCWYTAWLPEFTYLILLRLGTLLNTILMTLADDSEPPGGDAPHFKDTVRRVLHESITISTTVGDINPASPLMKNIA